ncbi:hypothetical protein JCM3765_004292 [Sporobolomyces pararoseus]
MHLMNLSLLFALLSIFLSISSSLVLASSPSKVDETFFKSLGEATFKVFEDTNLKPVQGIEKLFDSLPTENLKTREKHYKDKAGFDCHESIATSFGIIGADGDKSGEEKEKEEGDNLFRIQRRSKNSEEDEKSKAPDFVVKDGFFESAENEGDWF